MGQPRILVAYATRAGGTRGIARVIASRLERRGALVDLENVRDVPEPSVYDAAVIGSAVYFGSWEKDALDFVERNEAALRRLRPWLFSSGPLDWSDARAPVEPPRGIYELAERLAAREHRTFGGVLDPATTGMVGTYMADTGLAGDFRDMEEVRVWADTIAAAVVKEEPARA
jgi:menaquinone-dependent protoporphyrinogen oxidase